mgnify:CR=1 FL=1
MRELVVVSGKGGTGKTTFVASFAALADNKIMADCDVDAADLHLLLHPEVLREEAFPGRKVAKIVPEKCTGCGLCAEACRFQAIEGTSGGFRVDHVACEGCGLCKFVCPEGAIELEETEAGRWFVSDTPYGPMVHAKLGVAQENSGKLVTMVRQQARLLAEEKGFDLIITDGPPGIGCPMISAISGADMALVVTEPTLSGAYDMERALDVAGHFGVRAMVVINKADINPQNAESIRRTCSGKGIEVVGEVPFDPEVVEALVGGDIAVKRKGPASKEIERIWERVRETLGS